MPWQFIAIVVFMVAALLASIFLLPTIGLRDLMPPDAIGLLGTVIAIYALRRVFDLEKKVDETLRRREDRHE